MRGLNQSYTVFVDWAAEGQHYRVIVTRQYPSGSDYHPLINPVVYFASAFQEAGVAKYCAMSAATLILLGSSPKSVKMNWLYPSTMKC